MGLPRHLAERGETCCLRAWNLPLDFLQSLTLNGRPNQHSYPNHPALADPWGQPNASLDSHFISIGSDSSAIRESTRRHRSQTPSRRFRSFDPRDSLATGRQCEPRSAFSVVHSRPPCASTIERQVATPMPHAPRRGGSPTAFHVTTVQWRCTVEIDHATRRRPIPSRNITSSSSNQLSVTVSSTVLSIGATLPAAIFNSRRYTPGRRR